MVVIPDCVARLGYLADRPEDSLEQLARCVGRSDRSELAATIWHSSNGGKCLLVDRDHKASAMKSANGLRSHVVVTASLKY